MLVVSTSHISRETADCIEAVVDTLAAGGDGPKWAPTFTRDEGWVFYVGNVAGEHKAPVAPVDLALVMDYAHSHGCAWLMFDCDGQLVDDLPTFEW